MPGPENRWRAAELWGIGKCLISKDVICAGCGWRGSEGLARLCAAHAGQVAAGLWRAPPVQTCCPSALWWPAPRELLPACHSTPAPKPFRPSSGPCSPSGRVSQCSPEKQSQLGTLHVTPRGDGERFVLRRAQESAGVHPQADPGELAV